VPENQHRQMPEHEHYEALCALAAGGLLDGKEFVDLEAHIKECTECRSAYEELSGVVARELPQAQGTLRLKLSAMMAKPLPDSRQRFLRRARTEGIIFSPDVDAPARSWQLLPVRVLAPVAVAVMVAASLTVYHFHETPDMARAKAAAEVQRIADLKRENSALTVSVSRLNESLAAGQREIQNLRTQLENASITAENLRRNSEQARENERSSGRNARLLEESRNQEKLLAEARDEAARASQLRVNDEASLVEQQARITELSDKLRIASATLDMERRLAAAGTDVRELMAARQLHVIDVRDTDSSGNPSKAFGRVFVTEGKALTFYAFDLNEERVVNAKRGFQVWAAAAGKNSAYSLGFLHVDAKGPGRWVLNVENPELVKEISSVFVTVEPVAGGKQPSAQKMLYAYLGETNHP